MCGIVGLFLKDAKLEPRLGELTTTMLSTMCERGPDSAGFAVYGAPQKGKAKITLQSPTPEAHFAGLRAAISKDSGADVGLDRK
ncbi:glutamine amidotransferase, partial [Microbacteriaceae bacterium K1510]|nr:glutamine amidotransferase [Microbacteriaceae bacterium K1510]